MLKHFLNICAFDLQNYFIACDLLRQFELKGTEPVVAKAENELEPRTVRDEIPRIRGRAGFEREGYLFERIDAVMYLIHGEPSVIVDRPCTCQFSIKIVGPKQI